MLTVSLNEIYSETYKALRSLEIDWGLAKDCANLSKWLANHDQYFLGSLLKTVFPLVSSHSKPCNISIAWAK